MKPSSQRFSARRHAGVSLIECLVYLAVFGLLLGLGTAAFYFCWDHTRATATAAAEIESALRAGEIWRADVRAATGNISVTATPDGEAVEIPGQAGKVVYRFAAGELSRKNNASNHPRVVFEKALHSTMRIEPRGGVTAWRWELELTPPRHEQKFPLRFTFEAAPPKP